MGKKRNELQENESESKYEIIYANRGKSRNMNGNKEK